MMRGGLRVSVTVLALLGATTIAASQSDTVDKMQREYEAGTKARPIHLPDWPYPQDVEAPYDDQPHHVPGSTKTYTMKEVDGTSAVDWFPELHPKPPTAVIDGKKDVYHGCGNCHLMNGYGKPDGQSLNGMPVAYMQQQIDDMKNDLRHSTVAFGDVVHMNHVAKTVPEADIRDALEYFHSIGPAKVKWTRVVETETVPRITRGRHGLAIVDPSGATEPLGDRILEIPESYDRSVLRDPTSGFVAYVPLGSLAKGETLVRTGGGGRTMPCIACHGADLRGMIDTIPPLAGRSPTAIARQLYDFKSGARHGKNSAMMSPVVDKLTDEDIVDVAAYLASLPQ